MQLEDEVITRAKNERLFTRYLPSTGRLFNLSADSFNAGRSKKRAGESHAQTVYSQTLGGRGNKRLWHSMRSGNTRKDAHTYHEGPSFYLVLFVCTELMRKWPNQAVIKEIGRTHERTLSPNSVRRRNTNTRACCVPRLRSVVRWASVFLEVVTALSAAVYSRRRSVFQPLANAFVNADTIRCETSPAVATFH